MLNQEEINLLHNHLSFWDYLSQQQKDSLVSNAISTRYTKGQSLYRGERECIGLLLIKSGTLRTYITSEEGREVTLYLLEAGDTCILSASCVLQSIDFDVSIDAESDCDIIQISPVIFSKLSSEHKDVELFSYKLATERFSDVMWAIQQLLFTSLDQRLASFLLNETAKSNNPTIKITHEQLAGHLGSAREVVSRRLKHFENEGYLSLSRGDITVIDSPKLHSLFNL